MNFGYNLRVAIVALWALLVCFVVLESRLPATSAAIVSLHASDKVQHFGAYVLLALLPVLGFENRSKGMLIGVSMFLLGIPVEVGQQFSPGRAVEFGDVVANGVGVTSGVLLGASARLLDRDKQRSGRSRTEADREAWKSLKQITDRLHKLMALHGPDRLLLCEAALALAAVRFALWVVPIRILLRPVRPRPATCSLHSAGRICWAVEAVAGAIPKSTCLVRAIAG